MAKRQGTNTFGELNNRCHALHSWLSAMQTMGALPAEVRAGIFMNAVTTICEWVKAAAEEKEEVAT